MLVNAREKIIKQIDSLQLNLKGKIILTEAATGSYMVTPIIASMAGAKVFAFTKKTQYGTVKQVVEAYYELFRQWKINPDIKFIDKVDSQVINNVDVITNSGHLRPLDKEKLRFVNEKAVISLMYEAWEYRKEDLDLNYCHKRQIKVGGTSERHPDVDVFNYLGDVAIKLILDSGLCLYNNRFVLICNNDFGPYIAKVISKHCQNLGVIDKKERRRLYSKDIDWLGNFPEFSIPEKYKSAEAILFTAYPFTENWIGKKGWPIEASKLKEQFNSPYILRYAGDIDTKVLDKLGVRYFPKDVSSGHMGILPSAIGLDPILKLQAGGLKVGELMLGNKTHYKNKLLVELL